MTKRPSLRVINLLMFISRYVGTWSGLASALAAFIASVSTNAPAASIDDVFKKISQHVVSIDLLDGERLVDSYSGIVTGRSEVAVPCDGIRDASMRLRIADATRTAKLAHRDLLRNLCLLEVAGLDIRPVEIAGMDSVRIGDRVYAVGNTLGMGIAISDGIVSALRTTSRGTVIQHTAPVAPGSEGGGLFNASGQLVGVIRYRQLDGQNVNFAAPAEWLPQVAARAANQTELGIARDIAVKLARESKWDVLAEHARKRLVIARDDVETWRWLAIAAEQRNLHQEAHDAYKAILALEPDDFEATIGRGWALYRLGEHAAALDAARAGTLLRRENARPWLLAAFAQIALKQAQDAGKSFESAVAADPWNADAQRYLGAWALDSGDYAMAAAAFRMQSRLQRDHVPAWVNLANAYARHGRYDRALAAAEHAMKLDPNNGDAVLLKGVALAGLGSTRESIKTLERGLKMKPGLAVWGWYWLATAYREALLHTEALDAYREALRSEPKFVLARQWLAWTLEHLGYFDEALAEIDTVAKEDPELPWIGRRRATIHAVRGLDDKAIPEYERSLALDPKQPGVWLALVGAYRRNDRAADARRAYDRLLELDRREADIAYRENYLPFEGGK